MVKLYMANKTYAKEWLTFSKKNLDTARLLFNPNYCLPLREEIREILDFVEDLFERVCNMLEINIVKLEKQ